MESNRISLARVLDLGVRVSWREAAAIVHEAMALTGPAKGARPDRVLPESCVLTRGGEVVLLDGAAQARPETVLRLLEPLLAACDAQGGLGSAFEIGRASGFLEELAQRVTAKRRRMEIAGVAIRGLGARAEFERAESDRRLGLGDGFAGADVAVDLPIEIPPDLPRGLIPRPEPAVRQPAARVATPAWREPVAAPVSRHEPLVWPEPVATPGSLLRPDPLPTLETFPGRDSVLQSEPVVRPEPVAPNPPPPWRPVAHGSPPPWPPLVDPDAAELRPPSQTPTPPGTGRSTAGRFRGGAGGLLA